MTLVPQCGMTDVTHKLADELKALEVEAGGTVQGEVHHTGQAQLCPAGIPETGCSFLFLSTGSIVCGERGLPF